MSLIRNISNIHRISASYKFNLSWIRLMSSSTPAPIKPDAPKTPSTNETGIPGVGSNRASYKPDNLEKRFLVWTGKYKTIDEIPDYIEYVLNDIGKSRK